MKMEWWALSSFVSGNYWREQKLLIFKFTLYYTTIKEKKADILTPIVKVGNNNFHLLSWSFLYKTTIKDDY